MSDAFIRHTFTQAERESAKERPHLEEYFATRFAAKEAVFKAIAHLLPDKIFDLRIVETLSHDDGSPFISPNAELRALLKLAEVDTLHISITTQDDFATAFVIAEG